MINLPIPMNTLPKISALPLELSSKILQPFAQEREPAVCLQIPSVGNFTPFRMRGRTNRTYRFEWDRRKLCHVLRIPASLWGAENAMLAKDIFQQALMRPVIPTVELVEKSEGEVVVDIATPATAKKEVTRRQGQGTGPAKSRVRQPRHLASAAP